MGPVVYHRWHKQPRRFVAFTTFSTNNSWTASVSEVWTVILKCQSLQKGVDLFDWLKWQEIQSQPPDKVLTDSVGLCCWSGQNCRECAALCDAVGWNYLSDVKMPFGSKRLGALNMKRASVAAPSQEATHCCPALLPLWSLLAAWKTENTFCGNLEKWMCDSWRVKLEPSVC